MKIQNVSDAAFKKYGKVITGLDCSDIIAAMAETPCPENVVYVPGAESLESCASAKDIAYTLYGGMPVQIGYCNGNNHKLNGLEYHRDSEVNIAVTDLILLIGSEQDIENGKYDTSKVGSVPRCPPAPFTRFTPPRCTTRRAMQTTAASSASSRCRRARTTDIEKRAPKTEEDKMLFARNKWLLMHPEAAEEGQYVGLVGENIYV